MNEVTHSNVPQAIFLLLVEMKDLKKSILSLEQDNSKINPHERLTRKEIKEQYKICFATIHNLMKRGKLPFSKVGRKTLFKRLDVENCLSNKKGLNDG